MVRLNEAQLARQAARLASVRPELGEAYAVALRRCALMVMEIHPASFMDRASSITEFRRMLDAAGFDIIDHDALVIVAKRR